MRFMLGVAAGAAGTMAAMAGLGIAAAILIARRKPIWPSVTRDLRTAEKRERDTVATIIEEFRKEAAAVMNDPDAWLNTPNANLEHRTPAEFIEMGLSDRVREVFQSMKQDMHS